MSISVTRALKSVFKSPNWLINVMWLCLALLLNSIVIGNIFIYGYGSQIIKARGGRPERGNPDIDSNNLGDLFMKGLWPFLTILVASLAISTVLVLPLLVIFGVTVAVASQMGDAAPLLIVPVLLPLVVLFVIASNLLLLPFAIRSMVCQDFQTAFDFGWSRHFIGVMWKDAISSGIMLAIYSIGLGILGVLTCGIGMFPASAITIATGLNLMSQFYEAYLERGGMPVAPPADEVVNATVL